MAVCQIQPRTISSTFIDLLFCHLGLTLSQRNVNELGVFGLGEGVELGIGVDTRGEDEDDGGVFVGICIYTVEGRVGRMDKVFISILVHNEVDKGRHNSVSSDDLCDYHLPQTVALLVPLSRKGLLLWVGRHVPLLPFFCIVDESSDDVREIGQLLQIANCVPVVRLNPLIRVHGLVLPVSSEVVSSFEEEIVLFLVNFLQSDCHHESQKQFILFEQTSTGVSINAQLEFVSNRIKFFIERVIQPRLFNVLLDSFLEETNVSVKGELIHRVNESEIVDDEEQFRGHFSQLLIVLTSQVDFLHLGH